MHAMGVGGLIGLMVVVLLDGQMYTVLPMATSLLIGGLVLSSRLITGDHERGDVLAGFIVGIFSQFLSAWIL